MIRPPRLLGIVSALTAVLLVSGCSSFDPTDLMDALSPKKTPLAGERKPLFPEGTPGVEQGLPPELVKGYQPPATPDPTQNAQAAPDKPKAKAKPKPKVAAAPPANAPPPANAAPQPAAAQASPWPNAPAPRQSGAPGGVAWPDPPPVTR